MEGVILKVGKVGLREVSFIELVIGNRRGERSGGRGVGGEGRGNGGLGTCLPMTPMHAIEGGLDWEGGVGMCF